MVDDDAGRLAVDVARRAVAEAAGAPVRPGPPPDLPAAFDEPRGVFVTLRLTPGDRLRGCIGYPTAVLPLREAIAQAAAAAAVDDPRFPPVATEELARVRLEVSILTHPVPLPGDDPAARIAAIEVGRDGLIVDAGRRSGLLLPQVAAEEGWTAEEFLRATCEKAGFPRDAWRTSGVRVLRFEAEVFAEIAPRGAVIRVPSAPARSSAGAGPRNDAPRTPSSRPPSPPAADRR